MTAPEPSYRFNPDAMMIDERFGFMRHFAAHVRDNLGVKPGMRLLEVGCGSGGFTKFLASCMEGRGEIVGVDHDAAMVERASAAVLGTSTLRTRFETADAVKLPFPNAEFDAVVSQFLLCILPQPLPALMEMRRVTQPGGLVASLACFCKSGNFPWFAGLHAFEGAARLAELQPRFRLTHRFNVRNPGLGLPNGHDLDVWADYAKAGLTDLRITGYMSVFAPSDARWTDADAREYVEHRKRIEFSLIDKLTPEQVNKLEQNGLARSEIDELRKLLTEKFEWLLADVKRIRGGMEATADPAVLITGRVPPR